MRDWKETRGKIWTVLKHPNTLTLFRVAAVPILIILLTWGNRLCALLSAFVFSVAAITDYFDGYFARRYGLVSNLGKILDPLADKLLVASALIMLIPLGRVPAWMVCVILGRELAITGLRNIISEQGGDVAASTLGKYKTGFQIAAIIPLLIHFSFFGIDFHKVGFTLLWIALAVTLWSGADYFVRFRRYIEY
ncbi:MAG: CDP-diacylglycerol--glycerol-3-phosphate 3-phosphatidyltransferase [Deltaproteobacteria bacterium]|nr:CDP-diacylglycerol--glycerol-3-phosphate 3-phosphatidyltransferase [Deltaproteobacteria bacterium]